MDTIELVQQIKHCLPKRRPIEHHEPFIGPKDVILADVRGYEYVNEFEQFIKKRTKAEYAVCTNTGTAALHVALLASGVKYGDEVIVPTTTFVATSNAVSYCGATPHFVDAGPHIDPEHLRACLKSICVPTYKGRGSLHAKTISPITAIIVVHLLGFPADIKGICDVAKEFNLIVIEDASQAYGTLVDGQHVGTFGFAGTFSFNNNKIITTNGGGAVITNSGAIYHEAKALASTARKPHPWLIEHESMAFNYRMGNVNAAIGMSQAKEFDRILAAKRGLAARYRNHVKAEFVEPIIECSPNHWLNTILVDNRDELLTELHKEGIKARASFTPLHTLPFYRYNMPAYTYQANIADDNMKGAQRFFERAVCLPSGGSL